MGTILFFLDCYLAISILGLLLMLFTSDIFLCVWGIVTSFKEAFLSGVLHILLLIIILPFTIPHTIEKLFTNEK